VTTARRRPPIAVVAVAAVAVAFFALPLIGLLQRASWSTFGHDLNTSQSREALRLSLVCSLSATALSILFGMPLAWVLARIAFPGRALVRGLVLLPLVLPPVVGGVALLSAFSNNGLLIKPLNQFLAQHTDWHIQLTFTTAGAVLAETFVALPFFVITVEAALRTMDRRYEDVAATLGATITFAGNIIGRTQTLPLAVYLALEGNPDVAIALSLVLLGVSLIVIVSLRDRWLERS